MSKTTLSLIISISSLFFCVVLMATSAGNKPINQEEQSSIHNVYVTQPQDMIPTTPTPITGYNSDMKGISSGTPTPVYIVSIDTPTPTPSCLPSDTNCDGIVDDYYMDYDLDGYSDWYDPNPWVCNPCLKANAWYLSFDTVDNPDCRDVKIGENHYFDLFWDYSITHPIFGDKYHSSCNFPSSCGSITWSVTGGTAGVHYTINTNYSDADITFLKGGSYTVTATHNGWSNCQPITGNGCGTSYTSAPGGSDSMNIKVAYDVNPYQYIRNDQNIWGDLLIGTVTNLVNNILYDSTICGYEFEFTQPSVQTDNVLTGTVIIGGPWENAAGTKILSSYNRSTSQDSYYVLLSNSKVFQGWLGDPPVIPLYESEWLGYYRKEPVSNKHTLIINFDKIPYLDTKIAKIVAHETGHLLSLPDISDIDNLMRTTGFWGTALYNSQSSAMWTKAGQITWDR